MGNDGARTRPHGGDGSVHGGEEAYCSGISVSGSDEGDVVILGASGCGGASGGGDVHGDGERIPRGSGGVAGEGASVHGEGDVYDDNDYVIIRQTQYLHEEEIHVANNFLNYVLFIDKIYSVHRARKIVWMYTMKNAFTVKIKKNDGDMLIAVYRNECDG